MSDYLIHSGKLGMKWHHHDKDAYQTKSGNWVYGRNKPSESRNLKIASPTGRTASANGTSRVSSMQDIFDDIVKTNAIGKYSEYDPSRNQNCMSCAIAYDLRRAGNKVQAIETVDGMSPFVVADIYKNTKTTDYVISAKRTGTYKSLTEGMTNSEFDSMVNHLKSDGENSRGIMIALWKSKHGENYTGSHAMNYEVKNGKFYLIDSQIGKLYDEQRARKELSNTIDVMTLRTDNRQVNLDYAKSYFVEPEGTKTSDVGKDLYTAYNLHKIGSGLRKAGSIATPVSIGLSYSINPAFFIAGIASSAITLGGSIIDNASTNKARTVIQNNRNKTAANIIEKLTGDKVDPKNSSADTVDIMKRLPEYRRVYKVDTDDKHLDAFKIMSDLKTTDSDNTVNNTVNNTPSRNRAPIPVALPTDRNASDSSQIRNTRNKTVDKERENSIKKEVARARETGEYDMEFLERNLDIDPSTDKQFKGKAMDKAYAKYLNAKYLNAEYLKSNSNGNSKVASKAGRNTSIGISSSQKGSMKSLYAKGVPIDEIAEKLGVSPSTVFKYVK